MNLKKKGEKRATGPSAYVFNGELLQTFVGIYCSYSAAGSYPDAIF